MDLLAPIRGTRELSRVIEGLSTARRGAAHRVRIGGLWGSSCAYFVAGLSQKLPTGLLVITSTIENADNFASDFRIFSDIKPMRFPAWDKLPDEDEWINHDTFGERLSVLRTLLFQREKAESEQTEESETAEVVITPIQAMLQPVLPPDDLLRASLEVRTGQKLDLDDLAELLVEQGFERGDIAELPGEFAVRGGIMDVFPFGTFRPVRLEFFDDAVESIREYDPGTQRSLKTMSQARILAVAGNSFKLASKDRPSFLVYVPSDWAVLLVEPLEIQERAERLLAADEGKRLFAYEKIVRACMERPLLEASGLMAPDGPDTINFETTTTERFSGQVNLVSEEIAGYTEHSNKVYVFCNNTGEQDRLRELLQGSPLEHSKDIEYAIGRLSRGFDFLSGRTAFLAHHEIFHRYTQQREIRKRVRGEVIHSFLELNKNDFVVHIAHGIARYRGLVQFEKAGEMQEFLDLEFADKVRLYVPATKIDLVQKYVGSTASPTLSRLGGDAWEKRKAAARESVRTMALELLQVQAAREKLPGISCPPDDKMMNEFETSFIYVETDDQLSAIADVKHDMESTRPMDRLLCGDVGYGKTEVAMRAAFKAVEAGKQVAVLVPTTILAEQHFRTFSERMADYPVRIESVSRFKTKAEQRQVVEAAIHGKLDILIGTHRLLSKDVAFHDLGLLIIDEEQRFGVAHKERLKKLRFLVDVLTMTATPIPRTLHMALLGIRDISSLETPPSDRMAIHTEVMRFDEHRIREAILREMNRDGQTFFVHNRIYNINLVAQRINRIVPEARIIITHGQMPEHQLQQRMADFVAGKADILVTTAIIESGLDIPTANTIFIDEADTFGLADLHQLRGRVGRYKHRAYAYILLPESRPITRTSVKRLKAIEEYSELGAGFKLAMRDLEIRGAGNILGAEQSGHIAAVGYDLYCRLLEECVRELKHEEVEEHTEIDIDLTLDAYIPGDYIPSDMLKMEAYRSLARAKTVDDVRTAESELEDRYGKAPEPVVNLIAKHRLRVRLEPRRYTYFGLRGDHILLKFEDRELATANLRAPKRSYRILTDKTAHLVLPDRVRAPSQVIDFVEHVFGE